MTKKQIVEKIIECFENDGKLIIFGNGGSAAEASHMAAEYVGKGLPAIALNDPAILTALANDYGYSQVFWRQVEAIGDNNDLIIGLSTSGESKNVLEALKYARTMVVDYIDWPRKGKDTQAIQEYQLKLIHQTWKEVLKHFHKS